MKTTLSILCLIYVISAGGADKKPSEKKTRLTEAELRTIAISVPDTKTASMLHSVAMATLNNVDLRQEYLKAAAACLIACDKKDIYVKHIKGKLLDAEEFESELKDECKQCSGGAQKTAAALCVMAKESALRARGLDGLRPMDLIGPKNGSHVVSAMVAGGAANAMVKVFLKKNAWSAQGQGRRLVK